MGPQGRVVGNPDASLMEEGAFDPSSSDPELLVVYIWNRIQKKIT